MVYLQTETSVRLKATAVIIVQIRLVDITVHATMVTTFQLRLIRVMVSYHITNTGVNFRLIIRLFYAPLSLPPFLCFFLFCTK